jgi:hypothetical protein
MKSMYHVYTEPESEELSLYSDGLPVLSPGFYSW